MQTVVSFERAEEILKWILSLKNCPFLYTSILKTKTTLIFQYRDGFINSSMMAPIRSSTKRTSNRSLNLTVKKCHPLLPLGIYMLHNVANCLIPMCGAFNSTDRRAILRD